jgi:CBS domain-containing protein
MIAEPKPVSAMVAEDVMAADVMRLPEQMALRDAARLLLRNQVSGAPVVDSLGRCVGVLSSIDVLRLAKGRDGPEQATTPALPLACSFRKRDRDDDLRELHACTLPLGVCPIQRLHRDSHGTEMIVCSQPHFVLSDWQVVEMENLPEDEVRSFMTPDPVIATASTPVPRLARMMIDAHIHRIVIADAERKPIGVVTSTDILAAVAEEFDV